jgi:hypothetical protein
MDTRSGTNRKVGITVHVDGVHTNMLAVAILSAGGR